MYLADYHVHSRISKDCSVPMAEMAAAAAAAGLDEVCFTDHLDVVDWRKERQPVAFDWAALEEEFSRAQAQWGEKIRLRLGIELGDVVFNQPHAEALMAAAPPLDFVIGSIHLPSETISPLDLYHYRPQNEAEALRCIEDYLELALQMAKWGKFSVFGHLTLPLRYLNGLQGYQLSFDRYGAEVEEILRTLIQNGCGIELNTNRGKAPLPDEKWLRLYRKLGGEIITLGSDAHSTSMLGCAIKENQRLLRNCGFKKFCTFERMRPIWHQL